LGAVQDFLVFDSLGHLVPILSDLTSPQRTDLFFSGKVLHLTGSDYTYVSFSPLPKSLLSLILKKSTFDQREKMSAKMLILILI
jgi:hypothetical protein